MSVTAWIIVGIIIAVLLWGIISYNQLLTIGATVDPRQIPDVWIYADFLKESFGELREAADRTASTAGVAGVADHGWPKLKAASRR